MDGFITISGGELVKNAFNAETATGFFSCKVNTVSASINRDTTIVSRPDVCKYKILAGVPFGE